ncbi:lisH domain and HEAT repeat-containing protein KIAA1468 [Tanacetum coccineum]
MTSLDMRLTYWQKCSIFSWKSHSCGTSSIQALESMLQEETTRRHSAPLMVLYACHWVPRQAIHEHCWFFYCCMFEEHHNLVFNIIWEMVVSSNMDLTINAANLLKAIVLYVDAKVVSTHVLPALVTVGSKPNIHVVYASIDAFGTVAQNFKTDVVNR